MITIVIATYNRAHALPQSLAGCLSQTDKDIEIVVVDDGSTDDTEQVIQEQIKHNARIRYIKLEKNQGASVARNRGIQEAKGEWVMVWDSDDVLYPEAVATIKKVISSQPQAVVVSAPTRMMKGDREISYTVLPEGLVSLEDVLCKKVGNNEKVRCARKEAYLKAPYVSRNIDFMVGARLRAQGEWFHLAQPLGEVFIEGRNSLSALRKKKNIEYSVERSVHLKVFLEEFGEKIRMSCPGRYAALCYGVSVGLLLSGNIISSREFAQRAQKADIFNFKFLTLLFLTVLPGGGSIMRALFTCFDNNTA